MISYATFINKKVYSIIKGYQRGAMQEGLLPWVLQYCGPPNIEKTLKYKNVQYCEAP